MTDQAFDPGEKFQSQVPALQMLVGLGYQPLSPAEALASRAGRRRNVILESVLAEQLVKLNSYTFRGTEYPLDPTDALEAIRKLSPAPEQQKGLKATNQEVYDRLVQGATLPKVIDGDTKSHQVKYIDWADPGNNVFHVTVEYAVDRTGSSNARRLDVVAFVNGIPFVTIECKRPSEQIKKADHQLLKYQRRGNIPEFFHFGQLLIATNRREASYATVGTPTKFWSPWREKDDTDADVLAAATHPLSDATIETLFGGAEEIEAAREYFGEQRAAGKRTLSEQDRLLYSLCRPERLLELVRTFTVFDGGTRKVARHQQYFAVKRSIERVTSGVDGQRRPGGVVWHTQGSGKSLTMVMLAKALEFEPSIVNPRIILVTDRDDLDVQIRDTFRACQLDPVRAKSGKHLADLLAARTPLITTIVNKFENAAKQMENSSAFDVDPNVFVLVDESHRSHSTHLGEFGSFARRMRQVLPQANYIGFTGTPLLKREKNTYRTFGRPIHSYTIDEAVRDEAVVPLLYEGRMVEQQVTVDVLNRWFEKICQGLTPEQQLDLKRKFSRAEVLAGAGQVIRAKAFDISEHYRQHWQGTGFKAQLVAPNKAAAIRYKQVLDEIGHVTSEVMISAPGDDSEDAEIVDRESRDLVQRFWDEAMERFGTEAAYNRDVVTAFKSSAGPEILIVVSKLLTGFDAPRNTVLYLCRRLREHTLLQAIARVNRLFDDSDDGDNAAAKDFGYIIDYEGLLGELDAALTTYTDAGLDGFDLEDLLKAVVDVRAEIGKLAGKWDAVWALFAGIRHDDMEALEQHLDEKARRDEFYERLAEFTRSLHIALSSDKVDEVVPIERLNRYKEDWSAFVNLRRSVQWRNDEKVDLREYEPKIQKLLDDHLLALPAEVVIPVLNLNDSASLKAAIDETGVNAASKADRIATATKKRISERMEEDPALYARFAALVQDAIDAHRAHRLSEIDYLNRMLSLSERVTAGARDRVLPKVIADDADAASVFEAILGLFVRVPAGDAALGEPQVAGIALGLIDLVRSHLIVGIWQNEQRQNDLLNAIDDYLWDEVEAKQGADLSPEDEDAIRDAVLRIARARFA